MAIVIRVVNEISNQQFTSRLAQSIEMVEEDMSNKLLPKRTFDEIASHTRQISELANRFTAICDRYEEQERYHLEARLSGKITSFETSSIESLQHMLEVDLEQTVSWLKEHADKLSELVQTPKDIRRYIILPNNV